jgi:hypothetical protein
MVGGRLSRESLHVDDVREARRLRDKRLKEIKLDTHHGERRVSWKDSVCNGSNIPKVRCRRRR